jgi:hypothetical protein
MNQRSLIGIALVAALLLGQTFVPSTRAACAVPQAKAPAACPSCTGGPASAEAPAVTADKSCCAAPSTLSDREPARVAPGRSGAHQVLGVAFLAPTSRLLVVVAAPERLAPAPDPPGSSPPHLRTTILLI